MGPEANPFRYGALALDDAFTNREGEIAELKADVTNGQDVVVFAPRRYGKSSLIWRVAQELVRRRVLVASVDLMTTPTVAKLAEKLARTIHEDVASKKEKALDRLRIFSSLRVKPIVNVDPDTGKLSFAFDAGYAPEDLRATLEHLLALPGELGAERKRRVALIFDEFQEVVDIDPTLPRLMRAVFQEQPEVAHVYLGSKRHMMRRLFSDENEPFWRSAKPVELGAIAREPFAAYIVERFAASGRSIAPDAVDAVLRTTGGHPYATQELCYFLWAADRRGRERRPRPAAGRGRGGAALGERPLRHGVGPRVGAAAPAAAGPGRGARPRADDRLPPAPRPALAVDRAKRGDRARARGARAQRGR